MRVEFDIDTEKYRYSLVGDGYNFEDIKYLTEEQLKEIYIKRAIQRLDNEYHDSLKIIVDHVDEIKHFMKEE